MLFRTTYSSNTERKLDFCESRSPAHPNNFRPSAIVVERRTRFRQSFAGCCEAVN
ncbi:hypothetical protein Ancab_032176 [Ancistrocladus abbreviatus]